MEKDPKQDWLTIQEYKKASSIFLIEWIALFVMAWMFWSTMFFWAPGSVPPGQAAAIVAALYATALVYGRLLRVTGCRKCNNPLPFMRREVGRWHLRDHEHCIEVEYGGEEYGTHFVHVYSKVVRADIVTYRCRKCDQAWEERVELPSAGYKFVRRIDK